jgi:hypothetical protein
MAPMLWLIIGAIWLYFAVRALAFVVAVGWTCLSRMWAGVLWAAGGKPEELQQQPQPIDSWWVLKAQSGERQQAAGYADTRQGVVGDVYLAKDGEPAPSWVRKPGVTIDG